MYHFEQSHKLERKQSEMDKLLKTGLSFDYIMITLSHRKQRVLETLEGIRLSDDIFGLPKICCHESMVHALKI